MKFVAGFGAFVARTRITPRRASQLAEAGISALLIQVDFQGSTLTQRRAASLAAEQAAATAAGLDVWWWAWCRPGNRRGANRRPGGPDAVRSRLVELLGEAAAPVGFIANCEVGGGWSASRPDLAPIAQAVRCAGIAQVGLSSHGIVGKRWPIEAFDLGLPQLYRAEVVSPSWAERCLKTWGRLPLLWPTLGCADSSAAAMRGDLATFNKLGIAGATWWTERQLTGAKLKAAAPARPAENARAS